MRTNTLFLAAAALAAGLLGASAQSNVYSLNVVGYINVPFTAGETKLVANQLTASPNNELQSVIPSPSVNIFCNKFNPLTGGFIYNENVDGTWGGDDTTVSFKPGEAMYITAEAATTITFVGEVMLNSTNTLPVGVQTVGAILPQAGPLDTLSFPTSGNLTINQPKAGGGFTYNEYIDGAWGGDGGGVAPTVQVAEGFFVDNQSGAPLPWVRNFTP